MSGRGDTTVHNPLCRAIRGAGGCPVRSPDPNPSSTLVLTLTPTLTLTLKLPWHRMVRTESLASAFAITVILTSPTPKAVLHPNFDATQDGHDADPLTAALSVALTSTIA